MPVGLPLGMLFTMVHDEIYALPARRCRIYTSKAGATFLQSDDSSMTDSTAVTLVEGSYEVSGGFIQQTAAGDTPVILRPS